MSFDEIFTFIDLWVSSFGGITDVLNLTFGELLRGIGFIAPPLIANISLFSLMFAGLTTYFAITVIKWIIGIVT